MSVKIYGAFKLPMMSLADLKALNKQVQSQIQDEAVELFHLRGANLAAHLMDYAYFNGKDAAQEKLEKYDLSEIFYSARLDRMMMFAFSNMQEKANRAKMRDPLFDLGCTVTYLPIDCCILGIIFTEQRDYEYIFYEAQGAEDFSYWDNTDPPKDVTEEEWEDRLTKWKQALGDDLYGIPSVEGFSVDMFNKNMVFNILDSDKFIENFPSKDDRARMLAYDRLVNLIAESLILENPEKYSEMPAYAVFKARQQIKDNGHLLKEFTEQVKAELPEIETLDDLYLTRFN